MPPRVQPGNPDWVEWVDQLASRSEERGEKSAQTYKKAANSLRVCPIPFTHPDEALQLKGVGPKIVQHLVRKLKEQCEKNGTEMPDRAPSPTKPRARKPATKKRPSAALDDSDPENDPRFARRMRTGGGTGGDPTTGGAAAGPSFQAHPDGHAWNEPMSDEKGYGGAAGGGRKGKGKAKDVAVVGGEKEKKAREYIPRKESGPYAILLALYRCASFDEREQWTTKQRIMDVGQEYSATPFETGTAVRSGTVQGGAGYTYSAWSSMKTLTAKDLVVTDNKRPAKYALTPSGYSLAEKLAPSASIPLHKPSFLSSSAGHPSSSASLGRGGHPSSSGLGGAGDGWQTAGRGNVLGSSGGGGGGHFPKPPPPGIHAAPPRRRERTPPLFLSDGGGGGAAEEPDPEPFTDDDPPEFRAQMRQALALSRRESLSAALSSSPAVGTSSRSAGGMDPAAVARRAAGSAALSRSVSASGGGSGGGGGGASGGGLDGRKAASGMYAARAAQGEGAKEVGGVKNVDSAFGYFYLDENDTRTLSRSLAEVFQSDDNLHTLFRIEYRLAQDLHPMVRGLLRPSALHRDQPLAGGFTRAAFIKERVSNETAPGFPEAVMRRTATTADPGSGSGVAAGERERDKGKGRERDPALDPVRSLLAGFKEPEKKRPRDAMYEAPKEVRRLGADPKPMAEEEEDELDALLASFASKSAKAAPAASSAFRAAGSASASASTSTSAAASASASASTASSRPGPSIPSPSRLNASSLLASAPSAPRPTSSQNPLFASFDPTAISTHNGQIINRHPLDPVRDHVAPSSYSPPKFTPVVWEKGTFKVFLVVDSREGTREAGKRVELQEKMEQLGVPTERRMLPLGDMIWVAKRWDFERDRAVEGPGGAGGGGDVVLDAIVERKRLDDLCSSIIDGRYVGQKFRYKDSGISHRIYLIEKYDVAQHYEKFGKQIWTCKSQLQVNDGFFVHESVNFSDTINYLRQRTRVMQEIYENSPLHILPDAIIDRPTYLSLQHHLRLSSPSLRFLTSYASFSALNKPSAALTLRAQWGSMIQRVNGVSAEKAVQFVGRWPTPVEFWEEAKAHEAAVEAENKALDESGTGAGAGGRGKPKRRKVEDFVVDNLDDVGTRGIKGKVGGRIWDLFMTSGRYPAGV
ncbi:hypothetical protein JCM8097_002064 [Rhodosporidiobolus ruineniae]